MHSISFTLYEYISFDYKLLYKISLLILYNNYYLSVIIRDLVNE